MGCSGHRKLCQWLVSFRNTGEFSVDVERLVESRSYPFSGPEDVSGENMENPHMGFFLIFIWLR